jgi:hypothetical protein
MTFNATQIFISVIFDMRYIRKKSYPEYSKSVHFSNCTLLVTSMGNILEISK